MSELISSEEARLAWASGIDLQWSDSNFPKWTDLDDQYKLSIFNDNDVKFRIKPKTILINGMEIPAPFDPKGDVEYWYLCPHSGHGYTMRNSGERTILAQFGAWRTEEEIIQVVTTFREILKGATK
jgi:hypothetical protein